MRQVCENDTVTILYDGLLASGEKFDSSEETGPLQFQLGAGAVLPAFEQAVLGMAVEESKEITVAAKDAYGPKNEDLIVTVSNHGFSGQSIVPGMIVGMDMEQDGRQHKVPATVLSVGAQTMTVDFNHPLAGEDITYRITLLSIDTPAADSVGCGCGTDSTNGKGGCTPACGCGCS